jgi:hypothetical protein
MDNTLLFQVAQLLEEATLAYALGSQITDDWFLNSVTALQEVNLSREADQ